MRQKKIQLKSLQYKLKHPWEFVRQGWINLKNGWMRAIRGWCWVDLWNMDEYLLEIIPDMLRQLAVKSSGYPGREPFETPEKWSAWLFDMAAKLESCREENWSKLNEYTDEYMKSFDNYSIETEKDENGFSVIKWPQETKELHNKYFAREKELSEEAKEKRTKTLTEIIKFWDYLWD